MRGVRPVHSGQSFGGRLQQRRHGVNELAHDNHDWTDESASGDQEGLGAVEEEVIPEWQSTNSEAECEAGDDSPEPSPEVPAELRQELLGEEASFFHANSINAVTPGINSRLVKARAGFSAVGGSSSGDRERDSARDQRPNYMFGMR